MVIVCSNGISRSSSQALVLLTLQGSHLVMEGSSNNIHHETEGARVHGLGANCKP